MDLFFVIQIITSGLLWPASAALMLSSINKFILNRERRIWPPGVHFMLFNHSHFLIWPLILFGYALPFIATFANDSSSLFLYLMATLIQTRSISCWHHHNHS